MRTNRLFALALLTALVGTVPWLAGAPVLLRVFGTVVTLAGLAIAYLTGTVLFGSRAATPAATGSGGCGSCETCSCSGGTPATSA